MSTFAISKFCATMATAVLFVASLAPRAHAQDTELRADVPFAFQYGSDHYAAGRYTITHLSDRFIVLRSKSKAGAVMVQSSYGAATTTGKLVFNRYGNRYFLELQRGHTSGVRQDAHGATRTERTNCRVEYRSPGCRGDGVSAGSSSLGHPDWPSY
jgi:hypothetical protein